jgi:endonuclease G, mitochondrial
VTHLTSDDIVRVRDAADEADLGDPEVRPMLFDGVMRRYVRALPLVPAPIMQLHSDLTRMNQVDRLLDGTVPLEVWLRNAARLAVVAKPQAILQAAHDTVAAETSGEPELPPPDELGEIPEAIVHQDDTVPYDFLRLGWEAGTAVARLRVPQFSGGAPRTINNVDAPPHLGTGWLVTSELMITNHHVIAARARDEIAGVSDADLRLQGANATAEFGYDTEGTDVAPARFSELVAWGAALDYAVLRLAEASPRTPLPLAGAPLDLGEGDRIPVNIIQHPMGESKRVGLRNNLVDRATERDLRYFTDTRNGSSGSPVLDDSWRVLGLHRASRRVPLTNFQGKDTAIVNVGSQMHAILADLATAFPAVHREIADGARA